MGAGVITSALCQRARQSSPAKGNRECVGLIELAGRAVGGQSKVSPCMASAA
jgi:hypothetical protein